MKSTWGGVLWRWAVVLAVTAAAWVWLLADWVVRGPLPYVGALLLLLAVGLWPAPGGMGLRLWVLWGGCRILSVALRAMLLSLGVFLWAALSGLWGVRDLLIGALIALLALGALLWNGFLRIFCTSARLGVRLRVAFLLLWWCPVVNLCLAAAMYRRARGEYYGEKARLELDAGRAESRICATRYPILLVHGVFFRDWQLVNYWGRIPAALQRNGARVFYGRQQSAASLEDSARELKGQIEAILEETGCEKVNVIAHSKGGLDMRWAISRLGLGPHVASLTTINTPHRGCRWAQVLLEKLPGELVRWVADRYNRVFRVLGDREPDFLAAVRCLTADYCAAFDREAADWPGTRYRWVMSRMRGFGSGGFPLDWTWLLTRRWDGGNDGLVAVESAAHGEKLALLEPKGRRGISHGDVVDLFRGDVPGFDVREFYVQMVRELKEAGL